MESPRKCLCPRDAKAAGMHVRLVLWTQTTCNFQCMWHHHDAATVRMELSCRAVYCFDEEGSSHTRKQTSLSNTSSSLQKCFHLILNNYTCAIVSQLCLNESLLAIGAKMFPFAGSAHCTRRSDLALADLSRSQIDHTKSDTLTQSQLQAFTFHTKNLLPVLRLSG